MGKSSVATAVTACRINIKPLDSIGFHLELKEIKELAGKFEFHACICLDISTLNSQQAAVTVGVLWVNLSAP